MLGGKCSCGFVRVLSKGDPLGVALEVLFGGFIVVSKANRVEFYSDFI